MKKDMARSGMLLRAAIYATSYAALAYAGFGNVVASFPSPAPSPQALAWANGYLYCYCASSGYLIWKINPSNGSVLGSFRPPFADGSAVGGLAFDGAYFWCGHREQDRLYRFTSGGSVVGSYAVSWDVGYGLTWAGVHIWGAERTGSPQSYALYQMRPDGWLTKKTIIYIDVADLAFDGKYLWTGQYNPYQMEYIVSAYRESGMIVDSFVSPADEPYGATYGAGYLWLGTEPQNGRIWKIDISSIGVLPASLGKIKAFYR